MKWWMWALIGLACWCGLQVLVWWNDFASIKAIVSTSLALLFGYGAIISASAAASAAADAKREDPNG